MGQESRRTSSSSGSVPDLGRIPDRIAVLLILGIYAAALGFLIWRFGVSTNALILLVFAMLPGITGVINHLLGTNQGFKTRKTTVEGYMMFVDRYTQDRAGGGHVFNPWSELVFDELEDYRPRFAYTLLGSLGLTASFWGAVVVATSPWFKEPAMRAACWTTAGSFIYVAIAMIYRINSSSLTGKFLTNNALRVCAMQVLGFTAGSLDLLGGFSDISQAVIFFFIGLFPSWAFDAVEDRARKLLQAPLEAENLSLSLIDGIDHAVADRLGEIGIWDVQHLATSDPGELTLRSLYPLHRVLDWIDQAILITYAQKSIVKFRDVGIRGVIDFMECLRRTDAPPSSGSPSDEGVNFLASRSGISREALLMIYKTLEGDFAASLIRAIWQREPVFSEADLQKLMSAIRNAAKAHHPNPAPEAHPSELRKIEPALSEWSTDDVTRFEQELRDIIFRETDYVWMGSAADFKDRIDWRSIVHAVMSRLRLKSPLERQQRRDQRAEPAGGKTAQKEEAKEPEAARSAGNGNGAGNTVPPKTSIPSESISAGDNAGPDQPSH